MTDDGRVLTDVIGLLVCPVCGADFQIREGSLRCATAHTFDIARQGYVNLLPGNARPGTADTAEMTQARERFLGAGHFGALADLLADRSGSAGTVLDAGAGTGHYLGRVLDRAPASAGLAIDISKHALRRAARAHPRIGAAVADLWSPLPVRTGAVSAILNVFAPRNGAEFRRVLREDGLLYVVTPTPRHLGRLVPELGLLTVDERKGERTDQALGEYFELEAREPLETEVRLTHVEVETLVGMGPSAWHLPVDRLRAALGKLPDPVAVPLSVALSVYRPRGHRGPG